MRNGMIKDKHVVNRGSTYEFHNHHRNDGADVNPLAEIMKRLEHKYHYRSEEVALYHPVEKGTFKIRNTGAVEMFADQDTGIRVDPDTQSINMFANHYKSHIHHMSEWLTGSSNSYVKGHRTMKTGGRTLIHSGQDIRIEGKRGLQIVIDKDENVTIGGNSNIVIKGNAKLDVHGNVDANIKQHATIEVAKDLRIHSKQDVRINADRDIVIDAGRHLHTNWRCPDPSHYDPKKTHK